MLSVLASCNSDVHCYVAFKYCYLASITMLANIINAEQV